MALERGRFKVAQWISKDNFHPQESRNLTEALESSSFDPKRFLSPDTGDYLRPKSYGSIQTCIRKLQVEALEQLRGLVKVNRSMKATIFHEYQQYCQLKAQRSGFNHTNVFWDHLHSPHSEYREFLDQFMEVYCYRVTAIYLARVRFIFSLCATSKQKCLDSSLKNPSHYLSQIFKKDFSKFRCKAIESNPYSWYRPSNNGILSLKSIQRELININTAEFLYLFNSGQQVYGLSHKSFGEFITFFNNTMFPYIVQSAKGRVYRPMRTCKITGNNLHSLTLSYWKSRQDGAEGQACIDFYGSGFWSNDYFRLLNEVLTLTHFTCSQQVKANPIPFISEYLKSKYQLQVNTQNQQISLFQTSEYENELLYDQIFLNLTKISRRNPHPQLLAKIAAQKKNLKDDAFLVVFTNQKLFIPSQSEKIEQLLKVFCLKATFNFEKLSGRGQIPTYVYVFTKQGAYKEASKKITFDDRVPCLNFRFSGQLTTNNSFSDIVNYLNHFLTNKHCESSSFCQTELDRNIVFEFYQNSILDGRLIYTSSTDPYKVTHPTFFKQLTKSCIPLDNFFNVDSIELSQKDYSMANKGPLSGQLLGLNLDSNPFPYILIVNYKEAEYVQFELCTYESYTAMAKKHGLQSCQYFGLTPKRNSVNINLFRDYFLSNIGQQIVQLNFSSGTGKLKKKVQSVLIPKFFAGELTLPYTIEKSLKFFKTGEDTLLKTHPTKIQDSFDTAQRLAKEYSNSQHKATAWGIMGLYSYFQQSLDNLMPIVEGGIEIDYSNPVILTPLVNSTCSPLYPENEDFFIEFHSPNPPDWDLPLTHYQIDLPDSPGKSPSITLISNLKKVAQIYSEEKMLDFVYFLLQQALHGPISQVIQNLQVPTVRNFNLIIENSRNLSTVITHLNKEVRQELEKMIKEQLFTS